MPKPAYIVFEGHKPGVYTDWSMTRLQTHRVNGSYVEGFDSVAQAKRKWQTYQVAVAAAATQVDDEDDEDDEEYSRPHKRPRTGHQRSISRDFGLSHSKNNSPRRSSNNGGPPSSHNPLLAFGFSSSGSHSPSAGSLLAFRSSQGSASTIPSSIVASSPPPSSAAKGKQLAAEVDDTESKTTCPDAILADPSTVIAALRVLAETVGFSALASVAQYASLSDLSVHVDDLVTDTMQSRYVYTYIAKHAAALTQRSQELDMSLACLPSDIFTLVLRDVKGFNVDPLFGSDGLFDRLIVAREIGVSFVLLTDIQLVGSWDIVQDANSEKVTEIRNKFAEIGITLQFNFK